MQFIIVFSQKTTASIGRCARTHTAQHTDERKSLFSLSLCLSVFCGLCSGGDGRGNNVVTCAQIWEENKNELNW